MVTILLYVLDTSKKCPKCCQIKCISEFNKNRGRSDGLAGHCKQCARLYQKNRHLEKQRDINYRNRKKTASKTWRLKNRDKMIAQNRSWKEANPEQNRALDRVNRLRRKGDTPLKKEQVEARLAYYGYLCVYCKASYEEIDHFYPLSKGGSTLASNLVPACRSCNRSKYNKNPWDFINSRNEVL